MKNNTNLVDIVYSETIKEYVIIIKRFPDMPVVLSSDTFINIDLLCKVQVSGTMLIYNSKVYNDGDILYALELSREQGDSNIFYVTIISGDFVKFHIDKKETITTEERNEIINKILELREFLIEKGELNE